MWVGAILPKSGYLPTIENLGQRDFIVQPWIESICFLTREENCREAFLAVAPNAKSLNEWIGQYHAFIPSPIDVGEVEEAMKASGLFKLIS
jgi:hypothetical protein